MIGDFNTMLKGLADKNTEKEKETKVQTDMWLSQHLQKKDETTIDAFFEYIRTETEKSQSGSVLSIGAMNAFGIFAHSIRQDERLKEKYIPAILETLIQSYFQNDANPKTKKIITSNLLSVIMIAQYLVFPKMQKIMEILFRMKKDQTPEMITFSNKLDECLYPIIKNDAYKDKYKNIDIVACLKFMCTNFKLDISKINLWLLAWFNVFLSIDKLDLVRYMGCFFKQVQNNIREVITKVGQSVNEVNLTLEKFLKDLRHELLKKPYIKSRRFCIAILRNLTESCDPKSNKRKLLEVFKWIHDILSVQLSPDIASNVIFISGQRRG